MIFDNIQYLVLSLGISWSSKVMCYFLLDRKMSRCFRAFTTEANIFETQETDREVP